MHDAFDRGVYVFMSVCLSVCMSTH